MVAAWPTPWTNAHGSTRTMGTVLLGIVAASELQPTICQQTSAPIQQSSNRGAVDVLLTLVAAVAAAGRGCRMRGGRQTVIHTVHTCSSLFHLVLCRGHFVI